MIKYQELKYKLELIKHKSLLERYEYLSSLYKRIEYLEVDRKLLVQPDINLQEAAILLEKKLEKLKERKKSLEEITQPMNVI